MQKTILPVFISSILLLSSSISSVAAQQSGYRPEDGKLHIDFTLPRIDNREPLTLSEYRGKKVLLLHFASW